MEMDKKKAVHFYQLAAMGGDVASRFNLGVYEKIDTAAGVSRAIEHFKIAAGAGFEPALDKIERLLVLDALTEENTNVSWMRT